MNNLWKLFENDPMIFGVIDLDTHSFGEGNPAFIKFKQSLDEEQSNSFMESLLKAKDENSKTMQYSCGNIDIEFQIESDKDNRIFIKGIENNFNFDLFSEESFNPISDSCMITYADISGKVKKSNKSFRVVSGFTENELNQHGYKLLNSNYHDQDFFKSLWDTILSGNKWRGEIRNQNSNGNIFWVDSYIVPQKNTNGEVIGFVNFSIDITNKKLQEEELFKMNRYHELALDAAKLGSFSWDLVSNNVVFDDRWINITGFEKSKITIEEFEKNVHEKDKSRLFNSIKTYLSGDTRSVECVFRWYTNDSKYIFLKLHGEILECDEEGNPKEFLASVLDYTKDVMMEVNLKKSYREIEALIHQIPGALCFIDRDFVIKSHSRSWTKFWLNEDKNVSNSGLLEFFPSLSKQLNDGIEQALKGSEVSFEEKVQKLDGSSDEYTLEWKLVPWYKNNKTEGIVLRAEDISKEVKLRYDLEQEKLISIQTAKMASIGEVSGSIAHEINNPLTIINGYIQQMELFHEEGELTDEKLRKLLGKTQKTVMRVSKIVNGLKNFSRDGKLDDPNLTNVKNLIDTTLTLCSHKIKKSGVDLEILGDVSTEFICQEIQFSQVLVNLISNSCDEIIGHESPWIKIIVEDLDEFLGIRVIDSGEGIPNEIVKKLFTPYFTSKEAGKGTGLGMSISKNIVEAHKGSMVYERFDGHTSFFVKVPKDPTDYEESSGNVNKAS